jgi:cellulose 1,4-beta-cellobiosidase
LITIRPFERIYKPFTDPNKHFSLLILKLPHSLPTYSEICLINMYRSLALASALVAAVRGQQVGTLQTETHPSMTWQKCTAKNSCTTVSGKVVVDSNWRWVHDKTSGSTTNCYTGNTWDATLCPDDVTCATNCALEGADYVATYGATASGNSLKLTFVTVGTYATNIGSRLYLMDTDTSYQQFMLLNNEFTFDVDVSNLPCGLNGALYFVSMDKDGGMARFPANKAGAKYGVGYCDSQCPRDLKFIDGQVISPVIPLSSHNTLTSNSRVMSTVGCHLLTTRTQE